MKIAILGYGRMGKSIETVAMQRNHTIVCRIDSKNEGDLKNADMVINFSVPSSAFNNIKEAINNKIPVVSGTTGWLKDFKNIDGKLGGFQSYFKVYGRDNKNCSRIPCSGKIKKISISGRSSFYCNKCQN